MLPPLTQPENTMSAMLKLPLESQLRELLARTGLGQQLDAQLEADRAARHRERVTARAKYEALIAKRLADARAALLAAEAIHKAKAAEAEAALAAVLAASQRQSDAASDWSEYTRSNDAETATLAPPVIEAFKAELQALLDDVPSLLRFEPDPARPKGNDGTRPMLNNQAAVDRRAHAILRAMDDADRLKLADVKDYSAALAAIRDRIPEA